jgi:hypothetical protein
MNLILLLVNFIELLWLIFLFMISLGMSGHFSASPLWTCVNVDDYCDLSSAGTLTHVKLLEYICEYVLPLPVHSLQ